MTDQEQTQAGGMQIPIEVVVEGLYGKVQLLTAENNYLREQLKSCECASTPEVPE